MLMQDLYKIVAQLWNCGILRIERNQMEDKTRTRPRRINMEVPDEIHDRVKLAGIKHNCSITKWVLRAIVQQLKIEEQYK